MNRDEAFTKYAAKFVDGYPMQAVEEAAFLSGWDACIEARKQQEFFANYPHDHDHLPADFRPISLTSKQRLPCSEENSVQVGDRAIITAKTIPPTPDAVTAYSTSIGYPMDGQAWCDAYAQKGWMVGKTKMKDWHAAVRNWKTNGWRCGGQQQSQFSKTY